MTPSDTMHRRAFLWKSGAGFGALALDQLLAETEETGTIGMSPPHRHHPPRARRVVQLFMNGGVSPMDTFDHKPALVPLNGKRFDPGDGQVVESVTNSPGFPVMASPFAFRQQGQCGQWVSEVFPHMGGMVDDLAFLMSMQSTSNVHGIASYMQNTGFALPGFPCAGAWVSYALGKINRNLPEFVVMPDPRGLPYNNLGNFSSGFLPAKHQGTVIQPTHANPVPFLHPSGAFPSINARSESDGLKLLRQLNGFHLAYSGQDQMLTSRMESYENAARLQLMAPELFDLSQESELVKSLYGMDAEETRDFGQRCLTARRMLERDVRYIQIWSGAGGPSNNWDNHANIQKELPWIARQVDLPIAGFIKDLKATGLLDDTLVIWTTEFGRMPFTQGQSGRDHNGGTFVTWLAGAGVRPGTRMGVSDPWGWKAETPIWCYDLHATLLHLLGVDHTRLTFRHNGLDRRLTDVHGELLTPIMA
jgi:hypothetical protein